MTSIVGRRIISQLRGSNSNSLLRRAIVIRLNGTLPKEQLSTEEVGKFVIPAPVPGKIQAAVLKKFSEPLTIENVDPPKLLKSNEVSTRIYINSLSSLKEFLMLPAVNTSVGSY